MARVQRKAALRISSAYRTVSYAAAMVIAGVIPIDIKVQERTAVFNKQVTKTEAREVSIEKWQMRWSKEEKGTWTRRLIPNIKPWVLRRYGEINHFVTQALSGHGCFGNYLKRIAKQDTAVCWYCNEEDTPEHTLFRCNRWTRHRIKAENQVGKELGVENLIETMLENETSWDSVSEMITIIMKTKVEDERQRQKA